MKKKSTLFPTLLITLTVLGMFSVGLPAEAATVTVSHESYQDYEGWLGFYVQLNVKVRTWEYKDDYGNTYRKRIDLLHWKVTYFTNGPCQLDHVKLLIDNVVFWEIGVHDYTEFINGDWNTETVSEIDIYGPPFETLSLKAQARGKGWLVIHKAIINTVIFS